MGMFGGFNPMDMLGGGGGNTTSANSEGIGNSKSANDSRAYDLSAGGGDGSTVNSNATVVTGGTVTMGDYGAISQAMKLALAGVEGANKIASDTQAAQGGLFAGALSMAAEQNKQFASTLENIKTSDVRVLIVAGLAVVGMVGFAVFARRKKG